MKKVRNLIGNRILVSSMKEMKSLIKFCRSVNPKQHRYLYFRSTHSINDRYTKTIQQNARWSRITQYRLKFNDKLLLELHPEYDVTKYLESLNSADSGEKKPVEYEYFQLMIRSESHMLTVASMLNAGVGFGADNWSVRQRVKIKLAKAKGAPVEIWFKIRHGALDDGSRMILYLV